jgi:4-amino-4-deoxy-L-arabinose transferase-like glycosyltransferase
VTDAAAALPSAAPRWKLVLLQIVFLYLIGLRIWFDLAVTPMGDEAYYWMWGQHLSWSYFDHPPLNGWLQGLVASIFGWSNFSVRLTTWPSLGGTLWVFWLWSARLAPHDRQGWFWHTAVIYLTIPTVAIFGGVAFHDHLLLFFVTASLFAFHRFASEFEEGGAPWRWLYLSAALLGLAVLTKYNGIFLGIGYAFWVLIRPRLRPLLLTPHLWLAALLAVAIQAPVFYWNFYEGMASFRFHLSERPSANWAHPKLPQVVVFLTTVPLALSPILAIMALRLPWLRPAAPAERRAISLASTIYFSSLLIWMILAAYVTVYLHWNIIAYAALVPVAYRLLGGRVLFGIHVLFGLFMITVGVLIYTTTPFRIGNFGDPGANANYGWHEVAERVEALQAEHPGAFLGATRYTYAAQLGFQLHNIDVAAFNPVHSQNDYWWDAAAHAGQDAIIVADRSFKIEAAEKSFASMEQLETVEAKDNFGKTVWRFDIWLGRDFQPASP